MNELLTRAVVDNKAPMGSQKSRCGIALFALVLSCATMAPLFARSVAEKKQKARTEFETAEQMRDDLHQKPAAQRKDHDYLKVIDAYRRVYYTAPTSSKADSAVEAVAELLTEEGRAFKSQHALEEAIGQYEFLRKEYPGSKYRVQALFAIGQIYKDDIGDNARAKDAFEEYVKRYPHSEQVDDARQALKDIDDAAVAQANKKAQPKGKPEAKPVASEPAKDLKSPEVKSGEPKQVELATDPSSSIAAAEGHHGKALVAGIRHWSTPDYTRIAIDLENEVKYDSGRIPNPDRIYFDLKDTRLSGELKGKSFDVDDGYLKKIRVAQFAPGLTRVVLEVGDDVSEYSAFLVPNPYRLVIDIHGKRPATQVARSQKPEVDAPPKLTEVPVPTEKSSKQIAKVEPPVTESPKTAATKTTDVKPAETKPEPKPAVAKATTDSNTSSHASEVKASTETKPPVVEAKAATQPAAPVTKIVENDDPDQATTTAKVIAPPSPAPATTKDAPPTHVSTKKHPVPEKLTEAKVREAQPTSDGDRSLIRALGLKIGRIVIDAGHGGHDTGTIGPDGVYEKDVVLDVALKLGKELEQRLGAEVVYTREDDTFIPLETRTAIANQQQADLFISIHANSSSDQSARGVETYYLNFTSDRDALETAARENAVSQQSIHELQDLVKKIALKEKIEESHELAVDVQGSLHTGLASKSPAIRDRGVKKAPFIVLIGANMPSILAEISFISNPTDEKKLQTSEYRQKIADSLYKGIAKYVNGLSGVKVAAKLATEPGD
jgi:N-acetylmuramoyl-L-alanine amidase